MRKEIVSCKREGPPMSENRARILWEFLVTASLKRQGLVPTKITITKKEDPVEETA